jgi:hypothetical protein
MHPSLSQKPDPITCRPRVLFSAGIHADISRHITKSRVDDSCRVSFSQKKFKDSTMTKRHVGDKSLSRSARRERKRCSCADFAFMLEREDAANGPIILVTIFPPSSRNVPVLIYFGSTLKRTMFYIAYF